MICTHIIVKFNYTCSIFISSYQIGEIFCKFYNSLSSVNFYYPFTLTTEVLFNIYDMTKITSNTNSLFILSTFSNLFLIPCGVESKHKNYLLREALK